MRRPTCRCGSRLCARALEECERRRRLIVEAQELLFDDPARPTTSDPLLGDIPGLLTWVVAAA